MMRGSKELKPWHGMQNCRAAAFALLIVTAFILLLKNYQEFDYSFSSPELKLNSFPSSVQFDPSVEYINGTEVIWQIPNSPKGALFLAHGCNGRALNFWDRSPTCPNCIGLPEERLIALHALARKFAVLTISSRGICWSLGKERYNVRGIIKWWIENNKLEMLPITALGASSGGHFVSALATEMRFNSIVLMIAEGVFSSMDIPKDYPPTLFVHMPKDHVRARLIAENIDTLKMLGISVAEIKCMEFPLTPMLLSDRIPGLDESVSKNLFELFREKGFIDMKGYMTNDGRAVHWKDSLNEWELLLGKSELADHIQEEMNLAFAYHEMTSLQSKGIFDWFESHIS